MPPPLPHTHPQAPARGPSCSSLCSSSPKASCPCAPTPVVPAAPSSAAPRAPPRSSSSPPADYLLVFHQGLRRAKELLANPRPRRPVLRSYSPPIAPTTVTPVPGGCDPSPAELATWKAEVDSFADLLSSEDAALFKSGHRLSATVFAAAVTALPPGVAASRGLKIAGPPPSGPRAPVLADLLWLADAWFFVDPLLLEVTADMRLHGMNLAINGSIPLPPPFPPGNMFRQNSPAERIAKQLVDEDIAAGRSEGYGPLPSDVPAAIPMGLVPKGAIPDPDFLHPDRHRLIRNWSHRDLTHTGSLSDRTDHVSSSMQKLSLAVDDFARACVSPGAQAVKIDWRSAYSLSRVAPSSQWAMWSCFSDQECFVRTTGDFGMMSCGFRHELRAKVFVSLAQVMQHRILVDQAGSCQILPPRRRPPGLGLPPAGGFGSLADATVFSPLGKIRLSALLASRPVPPLGFTYPILSFLRWVDDFISFLGSLRDASAADAAITMLHRRYAIPVHPKKHFVDPISEFGGVLFDCPSARVSVPRDKCANYRKIALALLRASVVSLVNLQKFIGCAVWASAVFPVASSFMRHLFAALRGAQHSGHNRPFKLSHLARRELKFWCAVFKDIPSSRAAFVSPSVSSPASADVIVAFDWNPAAGQHLVGIAVLSHGLYTIAKVPPWFLKRHPAMSSPALEAMGYFLYVTCFPDIAADCVSFCFNDNLAFIQRAPELSSVNSTAFDSALQLGAFEALRINARCFFAFVDTTNNDSDSLSRDHPQEFEAKLRSRGFSHQFSLRSPASPSPPTLWRLLPR